VQKSVSLRGRCHPRAGLPTPAGCASLACRQHSAQACRGGGRGAGRRGRALAHLQALAGLADWGLTAAGRALRPNQCLIASSCSNDSRDTESAPATCTRYPHRHCAPNGNGALDSRAIQTRSVRRWRDRVTGDGGRAHRTWVSVSQLGLTYGARVVGVDHPLNDQFSARNRAVRAAVHPCAFARRRPVTRRRRAQQIAAAGHWRTHWRRRHHRESADHLPGPWAIAGARSETTAGWRRAGRGARGTPPARGGAHLVPVRDAALGRSGREPQGA